MGIDIPDIGNEAQIDTWFSTSGVRYRRVFIGLKLHSTRDCTYFAAGQAVMLCQYLNKLATRAVYLYGLNTLEFPTELDDEAIL